MNSTAAGWGRAIDSSFNRLLGREDSEAIRHEVSEMLDREPDKVQSARWRSANTDARVDMRLENRQQVKTERIQRKLAEVLLPEGLEEMQGLFMTKVDSNVRYRPGTSYPVVGTVPKSATLRVTAKLRSGWYSLEQNGVALEYIHSSLVAPVQDGGVGVSPRGVDGRVATVAAIGGRPAQPEVSGAGEKGSPPAPDESRVTPFIDLDAVKVDSATLQLERECRQVRLDAVAGSEKESTSFLACKNEKGVWRL